MQRVCFLGLPQAALLGSDAILLPPLDFPHVIRRVLGKQGMEMTRLSPPLPCSCRAVGGNGTRQTTSLKHRTWHTHPQHQDKAIPQGCVMLFTSPLPGGASLIPLGVLAQLGNDYYPCTKTQVWDMA